MIISRTPVRISFLGGGTDFQEYFKGSPGAVLGSAINKYTYIVVKRSHPFSKHRYKINYRLTELVDSIGEILHPSVRACLESLSDRGGLEIHYLSDCPALTGMGSSSTFTVGLLNALYRMKRLSSNPKKLADAAIHIERDMLGERGGWQDQIWASHGGLGTIDFSGDDYEFTYMDLSSERMHEFKNYLMVFYTGGKRFSHNILAEQAKRTQSKENDKYLEELYGLVQEGRDVLSFQPIDRFGSILHEAWELKKSLSSQISNSSIDEAYDCARAQGVLGGKILGAGGGGFLLVFAYPDDHGKIRESLKEMKEMKFELNAPGSRIILEE